MSENILTEDDIEITELPEAILRVADAGEKLLNSGLTRKAVILLLHDTIGTSYINKSQIGYVLDAIPELRKYTKKGYIDASLEAKSKSDKLN